MGKYTSSLTTGESEYKRTIATAWYTEFETPEQWVEVKLTMLRNEMFIYPTEEEVRHLESLKTENDINRAVQSIIDRHWN